MSPSYVIARFSGAVNVGTGSTVVRAADPSRGSITLSNDGANVIYVQLQTSTGVAPTAVARSGIRLAAGEKITLDGYQGAIAAIALTGATNLCVAET